MHNTTPGTDDWDAAVQRARSILNEYREKGWSDNRIIALLGDCCQSVPLKYISQLFTDAAKVNAEKAE